MIKVTERMCKIAESFGLELSEEFNIVGEGKPLNCGPYKFTERGLLDKDGCRWDKKMAELIRGIYTVEKLPWKPKTGHIVWYILTNQRTDDGKFENLPHSFTFKDNNLTHLALYKSGWLFRTKKDAEANLERVVREMREVKEND